ncbi:PAS domain S-box protein [Halosimplex halophilum]|uniref:PAS domain S-box protein n=1 Tax=Halosimplex halophilum TaxID=2559572 RepID=UPI00107FAB8F|nr:PAS domain S-box protein [Halosimplex halophilum]
MTGKPDPFRVLLVADDPELVAAVEDRRCTNGTVLTAATGETGLATVEDRAVDCVVAGHELPDWDGIELCRRLRGTGVNPPVILCPGDGSEALASDAISAGVSEYVPRPDGADPSELADRVGEAVDRVRSNRSADAAQVEGAIDDASDETEHEHDRNRDRELERQRDRYRAVFDEAFDAMVIADDEGRYVEVNDSATELFGLPEAELLGRSIGEFAPAEFDFEAAWRAFRESEADRGTFPLVDADGEEHVVEYAATTDIVPGQHLSVIRDVTDREERKRELEQREQRYANLVEESPAPINLFDSDGETVWGNDALVDLLGVDSRADLVGRSVFDFIHPDDHGAATEELERVFEKGDAVGPTDIRLTCADGETRHVRVKTTLGWYEGERVGQAVVVDITELRELESKLRRNERRYRTLVEMSPEPILVHSGGTVVFANDAAASLAGVESVDRLVGTSIVEYVAPDERHEVARTARRAERGESAPTDHEWTIRTREGEQRHIETTAHPITYEGEQAVLTAVKDVTDRFRHEAMLTALNERVRAMTCAEGREAIATVAAETLAELLDLDGAVVFEFDGQDDLVPLAPAEGDDGSDDRPRRITDGPVWDAFASGEVRTCGMAGATEPEAEFPFVSVLVVPVGNHGVLVGGATSERSLTTAQREVAELVAENLEAALDRAENESAIRERDSQLRRQNQQLEQLNRLNRIIREINQALVRSTSEAEIRESVCDRLSAANQYAFTWVGERDPSEERTRPLEWAGVDSEYVDTLRADGSRQPLQRMVDAAYREGSIQVVDDVLEDDDWERYRKDALTYGFRSIAVVPVCRGDAVDCVLVVYAEAADTFDGEERRVLEELGDTVGYALRNVRRTDAVHPEANTEVELTVGTERLFANRLSAELGATVEFVGAIDGEDGAIRAFFRLDGESVEPDRLTDFEFVRSVQPLSVDDAPGLYQLTLSTPPLFATLRADDAQLRALTAENGTTTLTVVLTGDVGVRPFVDDVQSMYPETELRARREDPEPVETRQLFRENIVERLTERQFDALRAAHYGGFFEWPRVSSSSELAETRDIAASTFQYHLRAAERKVIDAVLGST